MKLNLIPIFCLTLTPLVLAQGSNLTQATQTFTALDTNKDGKLSSAEYAVMGQDRTQFTGADADGDGQLVRDEFVVFYRQRLIAAGQKPAADLEAESTRILAARRAKQAGIGPADQRRRAAGAGTVAAVPAAPANLDQGLQQALQALDERAAQGKATPEDVQAVKNQLIARARAANQVPNADPSALEVERQFQQKWAQSLDRMEAAAREGKFSREEFNAFRQELNQRLRNQAKEANGAVAVQGNPAGLDQALQQALQALDERAAQGKASPEDVQAVKNQLIARARAANQVPNADPSALEVERQFQQKWAQSLDRMEAAAREGKFSREELNAFRQELNQRLRNQAKEANGAVAVQGNPAGLDQALQQALQALDERAAQGKASPEDVQAVKNQLIARARAANQVPNADPSALEVERQFQQKWAQSLDRMEAAAREGKFSREELNAFRQELNQRLRNQAKEANGAVAVQGNPAGLDQALQQALQALDERAAQGKASPEDVQAVKNQLIARARAANQVPNADPSALEVERQFQQKWAQSLDRMEAAAREGKFSREELNAFRQELNQRLRNQAKEVQTQVSSDSQSSSSSDQQSSSSSDQQSSSSEDGATQRRRNPAGQPEARRQPQPTPAPEVRPQRPQPQPQPQPQPVKPPQERPPAEKPVEPQRPPQRPKPPQR